MKNVTDMYTTQSSSIEGMNLLKNWFTNIRKLNEQNVVFDFFFDVSNQILVEILTDAFNTYAVPKYGLEPIEAKKRYKRTLAYTKEALDEYKPRK